MTADRLKNIISDCCDDITFLFKGKKCGIFPTVENGKPTYGVWFGDKHQDFFDVDSLMTATFFDGKSLSDIAVQVDVQFY